MRDSLQGNKVLQILSIVLLAAFAVLQAGCGTDSYDEPSRTRTGVLIEPETLKEWIDQGKVNASGYDKVVILEVTSSASDYRTEHIPGAIYVDRNDFNAQRVEGVAPAANMILAGTKMNEIIQRTGIDGNTTVVITINEAGNYTQATRAYFAFRYWGFPKEKIKFLNGYNKAFKAAYPAGMTTAIPTVTSSTYSVQKNSRLRPDFRASIGEMITAAGNATAQIIDVRGAASYAGSGTAVSVTFTTPTGTTATGQVNFEGHIAGAVNLSNSGSLLEATGKFKSAADLDTIFFGTGPGELGLDRSKRTFVYCVTGTTASSAFFVLDAILDMPVELYDGSWSQWGLYTNSNSGKVTADSAWDVISLTVSGATPAGTGSAVLNPGTFADFTGAAGYSATPGVTYFSDTQATGANQIENEDAAYIGTGGGTGSGGIGSSSGC